jgi:4-alpha-glucanotransferase
LTTTIEVVAVGVGEELPKGYEQTTIMEESQRRRLGVLASLHCSHNISNSGDEALAFLAWLHDARCTLWQVTRDFLSL